MNPSRSQMRSAGEVEDTAAVTWWFLETTDGKWLANDPHGTLTRDPNAALKWPNKNAADDYRRGLRHPLWAMTATEHMWVQSAPVRLDPLHAAREAFLGLIADAVRWDEDVDGEYHTDSPVPTVTVRYFAEFGEHSVRELVEALGIPIRFDECAGDAIARALAKATGNAEGRS